MVRVVDVAGMRIQIDQELTTGYDDPAKIEPDRQPQQYIDQNAFSCDTMVETVMLTARQAKFSAAITVLSADDPAEVGNWTVGFAQNVVTYNRYAFYGDDLRGQITENFQYGAALRDSDIGSLPFYERGGGATEELQIGVPLQIECRDDPRWPVPVAIHGRGVDASLTQTQAANRFMIWLMLARTTDHDRRIVLLGRAPWRATLDAKEVGGGIVWTDPVTTVFGAVQPLEQQYDASTIPPVGGGELVPDLRELEAHTYIQGHLTHNDGGEHRLLVEWIYTDAECAVPWEQKPDPTTIRNWLAGEQTP
ncbi:hypothetical protein [Patulibacter defluvii]|uniref:hypothetical protein n=1 Tax=Patulibacter defluvii TaxID=3095358 RepID=UPI002A756E37|nr:hypothetical protein [Patulibacter sp. DM4]